MVKMPAATVAVPLVVRTVSEPARASTTAPTGSAAAAGSGGNGRSAGSLTVTVPLEGAVTTRTPATGGGTGVVVATGVAVGVGVAAAVRPAAPTCISMPSAWVETKFGTTVNVTRSNEPVRRTVPFESVKPPPLATWPVTVLPATVNVSPLTFVTGDGNVTLEASELKSNTGSVTAAPNATVYVACG